MAGEFNWAARLKSALLKHFRGFILVTVLGLICFVYLFFKGQLTVSSTPVFLIVVSNCWGLFLITVLLGYGLVEIPRSFWESGKISTLLCKLYMKATHLDEGIMETKFELDEIVKLVNTATYKLPKNSELQEPLNYILSLCPLEILEHQRTMQTHLSKDATEQLGQITMKTLIKLHKSLKDTLAEYQRSKFRWEVMIEEALYLEDIITASDSPFKRIVFSFKEPKSGWFSRKTEVVQWFWLTRMKPLLFRVLGVLFVGMSVLVVLGETTLFLDFPVGVFPLWFAKDHGMVVTQLLCIFPLAYIILCTYFGLFNLKLSGWYGLYPKNHTDSSNLVWSAFFLARLSAPLCYNFLLFLKIKNTVYSQVMKTIDLVPLVGSQFTLFFPFLVIVFCGLNLFNVYGRLMSGLGMSNLSFSDKLSVNKVSEGKLKVQRARNEREKSCMAYNRKTGNLEMANRSELNKDSRNLPFRRPIV